MSPGTALVFYVHKKSVYSYKMIGRMDVHEVVERIKTERAQLGACKTLDPGVLYIESRNLNITPTQRKGCLVAYQRNGSWHIGYVWNQHQQKFKILEWIGEAVVDTDAFGSQVVPDFHLISREKFTSVLWSRYFRATEITVPEKLQYLNQVYGRRPFTSDWMFSLVGSDGKIECSLNGPDVEQLPHHSIVVFPTDSTYAGPSWFRECPKGVRTHYQELPFKRKRNRCKKKRKLTSTKLPPYSKIPVMQTFDRLPMGTIFIEDSKLRKEYKDPTPRGEADDKYLAWPLLSEFTADHEE
jgi:hypothetical protein